MSEMRIFSYSGPVEKFGKVVCWNWKATTTAVSLAKARNNLEYRYKQENNIAKGVPIKLLGYFEEKERA